MGLRPVWVLTLLLLLASVARHASAAEAIQTNRLTTTSAIQGLSRTQADLSEPAEIEGVVTYSHAPWRLFFVEDNTGGIYVEPGGVQILPPAGHRVHIDGFTGSGAYLPVLNMTSFRDLGPAPNPPARPVQAADLWRGQYDGDLVRLTGHVASMEFWTNPAPVTELILISERRPVRAILPGPASADDLNLYGAQVEVTGTFGPRVDAAGQISAVGLCVQNRNQLRVLKTGAQIIESLPLNSITNALTRTNQVVHIRAQVTQKFDDRFWIADADGGSEVVTMSPAVVQPGDSVDLVATVSDSADVETRLYLHQIISRAAGTPLKARALTITQLFDPSRGGQYIKTTGEFLHLIARPDGDLLVLRDGNRTFEARLRRASPAIRQLAAGTQLELTGCLRGVASNRPTPRVVVANDSDLVVLSGPPWPLRRTLAVVVGLALALMGGLVGLAIAYRRLRDANTREKNAEAALRKLNSELEERIQLRTAQVETANRQLSLEIEQRRQAQDALVERETRFRLLIEGVDAIVWEFDPTRERFTYVSPQAARLGHPLEAWLEAGFWLEHLHPEDRTVRGHLARPGVDQSSGEVRFRLRAADGNFVWFTEKVAIEPAAPGTLLRGVFIDISRRQEQEAALRESEERFARAFQASPAHIAILSFPDGRVIDANDHVFAASGYTREEMIGRTTIELGLWADPKERHELMTRVQRGEQVRGAEFTAISRDGRRHTLMTSLELIVINGRRCLLSINQDITERKRAENALRESEERFAKAFHASPALVVIIRRSDHRYIDVNARFTEVLGYPREECIGRTALELRLWAEPARRETLYHLINSGAPIRNFEIVFRTKSGQLRATLTSIENIDIGGEPCLLGISLDVTDRQMAEQFRDEQTRVLELIAQGAPLESTLARLLRAIEAQAEGVVAAIQIIDPDGKRLRHGAAPSLPPAFNLELDGLAIGPNAGSSGAAAHRRELIVVEDISTDPVWVDHRELALSHELRSCWATPIFDEQHRLIGTLSIYGHEPGRPPLSHIKLIEAATYTAAICLSRFRTGEALRLSEERFQHAMRGANDGLFDWTLATDDVYYSPRWKSMLGYEDSELPNHLETWRRLVDPEQAEGVLDSVRQVLSSGSDTFQARFRMRHKDDHWVMVHSRAFVVRAPDGRPLRMVGTHIDITDRSRAEQEKSRLELQLRQSQKMEAIGTLAGGIAHDFNNILGAIIGYAQLARRDARSIPSATDCLDQVLRASLRAKELVRQILTFSRHEEFQRSNLSLDAVVSETVRLLRATLPASLEIVTEVSPPVPRILGNHTLLQQVLVNLVTNAAQALGEQPGRVVIQLQALYLADPASQRLSNLGPGTYTCLTVHDNGPGIDPRNLDRIFEPFFTTKGPGEGTGLGLSVVHGIIESHNGAIRADSQPGQGTTFTIYIPTAERETANPSTELTETRPAPPGSEHVLLVDDEASLLKIGERYLRQSGYEVTTCSHPDEATKLFRENPDRFDLVITDYSMPSQSGFDLGSAIRKIRPSLPIVICTGYGAGLTREKARLAGFDDVLQKPVELQELGRAVRAALDGRNSGHPPADPTNANATSHPGHPGGETRGEGTPAATI